MLGLIPVFVDGWIGQGENVLRAIERHQIAFVQLFLPMVLELEKLEDRYDIRSMLSSLKGASFAGMPLGRVLTEKVRDEWGVNLFTYTSAGDTGTAWEGREHDGYFLWEDTVLAETLDPVTGAPVGDREVGELVATDLDNWAAPYVRFRSGDIVGSPANQLPSGRTHARMWALGRSGDEMIIGGKAVMLADVWQLIESVPELGDGIFQVVRYADAMDRLRSARDIRPNAPATLTNCAACHRMRWKAGLVSTVDVELCPIDDLLATVLQRGEVLAGGEGMRSRRRSRVRIAARHERGPELVGVEHE